MAKNKAKVKLKDMGKKPKGQKMTEIVKEDLMPLPFPYDNIDEQPDIKNLKEETAEKFECDLDGFMAIGIPRPQSKEEEEELIQKFLNGLKKLLSQNDNWTFWQPLMLSLEYCAKCQTCSDACQVYLGSGKNEIYRPTYRSEVLRRIINKYIRPGGKLKAKLSGEDIELNWELIARLAELAYRCTICRRCASTCPMGVDNALITHELRKLFSQEMGIAPPELHKVGSMNQLKSGSSTGMTSVALKDNLEFMEDEIEEKLGYRINIPVDVEGADILLIHNAGEFLAWPENPEAFDILFHKAGLSYTLSSDLCAYDAVNYGLWYDDVQLARVAVRQAQAAKKLGVKKIVIGECGHAHKAISVIADRVLNADLNIPRESCLTTFKEIVDSGKIKLDPSHNDFPVTLHDPCNVVRLMGIYKPQRDVLDKIAPRFREMTPNGTENYCCGGGSGFAIIPTTTFPDWRVCVSCRMKFKQILDAFTKEELEDTELPKYVCAPCSNCKGAIRDIFNQYNCTDKYNLHYGGLVELIVNAMTDLKEPFITWEAF